MKRGFKSNGITPIFLIGFMAMIFLSCFLASVPLTAQTAWAKAYDTGPARGIFCLQQTSDEGYIVTGDLWIQKLDSSGNIVWEKSYIRDSSGQLRYILQTNDGGYIVAGNLRLDGVDNLWVLKLDSTAGIIWERAYESIEDALPYFMQQTGDGNYILAGEYGHDLWLVKLDATGNVLWQKTFGGEGWDWGVSVRETYDGGYLVLGNTFSVGAGEYDFWVLKLDNMGNIIWEKTYGSIDYDLAYSLDKTADGGYIVAGDTQSVSEYQRAWVLKLDSIGNVDWQNSYSAQAAFSVQQTSDGRYILVGIGTGGSYYDGWISKLNFNGSILWQKKFHGTKDNLFEIIHKTRDGGYIIGGWTDSFEGNTKELLLKIDEAGDIPGCPLIETSDAIAYMTNIVGIDSVAVVEDTSVVPVDTATDFIEDESWITEICSGIAPPLVKGNPIKLSSPFRIKINGGNFHTDIKVFIGGEETPWENVSTNPSHLVLKKGFSLKEKFPKGVSVEIKLKNGNGGETTTSFTR